ncbi:MAG: urea carboxylase-associated family protein [Planctomycetes bacterium]|nr:urea carboxylase-associated family protein [Planctomycetota bacterium]
MDKKTEIIIPPMSARALVVAKGETLRIVDVDGRQPGDLVVFNADDLAERFSQSRTRVENRKIKITTGDRLWTNTQPPKVMFTIAKDTCGAHDLLYTPCCRYALETRFGVSRDGCLEHLAEALDPWGIGVNDIPDPLNLFFDVAVSTAGDIVIREPTSKPDGHIDLRAEMDCLAAVSTCSVPLSGKANSAYRLEVFSGT